MAELETMIANLRIDLRDSSATPRWSDADLTRCVAQAVDLYSHAAPLVSKSIVTATGVAEYDLSATPGWLYCVAVEYPSEQCPPRLVPFAEREHGKVRLLLNAPPGADETIWFWYAAKHRLDATAYTVPAEHREIIAIGAVALALLQYAAFTIGRAGTSGDDAGTYREEGQRRLNQFARALETLRVTGATPAITTWRMED